MTKTAKISVGGMMCPKCAQRIEKAILNVTGVNIAEADVRSKTVSVVLNDGCEDILEEIKEAVEGAGYEFCGTAGDECR